MKKQLLYLLVWISLPMVAQTGIGTSTPVNKFQVETTLADPATSGSAANGNFRLSGTTGSHVLDFGLSSSSTYSWLQSRSSSTYATNFNLALNPNGGNVGIGTITPSTSLHIQNSNTFGTDPAVTNSPSLYVYNTNNTSTTAHATATIRTNGSNGGNPYLSFDINGVRGYSMGIDNADGDKFKFHTNWNLNNSVVPAFTVTTDNRVGIGTTSPASRLHINSSDPTTLYIESTTSDNNGLVILNANTPSNWNVNHHEFMMFQKQGSSIGFIGAVANNNSINYSTTSDYRLKTDLQDYSGLNIVNKIKTYDYAWKSNNYRMHGVMAHELQEVVPYAVSGEKDAVDKDGKITPQAVDYSKLTPVLVKAIQEQDLKLKEQQLQIETLMKRLEIIESKIK